MCSSSSHHVLGHVPTVFQRVPCTSVGTWNTPDNAVTSRNLGTRSRPTHITEHNHHPARQVLMPASRRVSTLTPMTGGTTPMDFTTPSPGFRTTPEERLTAFFIGDF